MFRRILLSFCLALALLVQVHAASAAGASPKVHRVAKGQTLGKIAKRYHVSIADLCEANHIRRRDPIHPGQELVIPTK